MYAILFVLLLIVLAAIIFLTHMQFMSARMDRHQQVTMVRLAAERGAEIINACEKEQSTGVYTVSDLISNGYLPNGFPQNMPLGFQWGCQVSNGGVNGGNVYILTTNGPFSYVAGMGNFAQNSNTFQENLSWDIAEDLNKQVFYLNNTVVGVLPENSEKMESVVSHQKYDLSGLINENNYAIPIVASGLIATSNS